MSEGKSGAAGPQGKVAEHQDDSDSDGEPEMHQYKIILLGDGAVGKTSVANRFTEDYFSMTYKQTIGVDFFIKRLVLPGDVHVALQIWDIGGQSIGSKMISNYIYGAQVHTRGGGGAWAAEGCCAASRAVGAWEGRGERRETRSAWVRRDRSLSSGYPPPRRGSDPAPASASSSSPRPTAANTQHTPVSREGNPIGDMGSGGWEGIGEGQEGSVFGMGGSPPFFSSRFVHDVAVR